MSGPGRALILASRSPRRRQLLSEAGFAFQVEAPDVDETPLPGESPEQQARRLAEMKADAIARGAPPGVCVLAADTLVVLGERVLGKPRDVPEAQEMLLSLAGRVHRVLTGFALVVPAEDRRETLVEESRVRMRPVSAEEAARYAAGGEPLDKAGAYAVQGEGGRFVERIDGSRTNVIGLPMEAVAPRLVALGVHPTCRT